MTRLAHVHGPGSRRRRGTVLIITMFVVLVLAAMTLVFARQARVDAASSANRSAQMQAQFIARGALQYVIATIAQNKDKLITSADLDTEAVALTGGRFWLIKPDPHATEGLTFGLIDEASKLNLNTATNDMLLKLPHMTDELAASILDWRDGDTDTEPGGAESDYYLSRDEPYQAKDSPLELVDELLLVRGATRERVFGEDANLNNVLDDNENDGDNTEPADNRDSVLDRGLADYLTVYTIQPNRNADGEQLINVNDANPSGLRDLLEQKFDGGNADDLLATIQTHRPYRNLMDFYIRTEMSRDEFNQLVNSITTRDDPQFIGLVNVNTAPLPVLAALPMLDEADAQAMIAARESADIEAGELGWITDAIAPQKAAIIGDFITGRTYQYTADILATSAHARSFVRLRVVIDASTDPPRVVHYTDLSALGWPLAPELLAALRAGEDVQPTTIGAGKRDY